MLSNRKRSGLKIIQAKHKVFDSLQTGGCRDFYIGDIQSVTGKTICGMKIKSG